MDIFRGNIYLKLSLQLPSNFKVYSRYHLANPPSIMVRNEASLSLSPSLSLSVWLIGHNLHISEQSTSFASPPTLERAVDSLISRVRGGK